MSEYMIMLEPGIRLTSLINGKEFEITFSFKQAAENHLNWVRKEQREEWPQARVITVKEWYEGGGR